MQPFAPTQPPAPTDPNHLHQPPPTTSDKTQPQPPAGYVADPPLAASVISQLTAAGLRDFAWQEVDALVVQGHAPGPEHYGPLIRAEAAMGAR